MAESRSTSAAAWHGRPTVGGPLVTCPISQTFLELTPKSLRIRRPFTGTPPEPSERKGTTIQGFSKKSRSRLHFTAANSDEKIRTQFCMTCADVWLVNGRSPKADLNRVNTSVKKSFPVWNISGLLSFRPVAVRIFISLRTSITRHTTMTL